MTFEKALSHVLRFEGGYSDHPHDPGGATNFGITQATYDAWRSSQGLMLVPVKDITRQEVETIYRERYWQPARCDELPASLRLLHFDAAVNCGVANAIKFLQRALGVTADGIIGPITRRALQNAPESLLAHDLLWERLRYYHAISARSRPDGRDLRVFLLGWLARVLDLRSRIEV